MGSVLLVSGHIGLGLGLQLWMNCHMLGEARGLLDALQRHLSDTPQYFIALQYSYKEFSFYRLGLRKVAVQTGIN